MSSVSNVQNHDGLESMFWCCLYVVERSGAFTLVYGYAINVEEPSRDWGIKNIYKSSRWSLSRFTRFLSAKELHTFQGEVLTGSVSFIAKIGGKPKPFRISTGNLEPRPDAYAAPKTEFGESSPMSFSDDLARIRGFWCLSKRALIEKLFPEKIFGVKDMRSAAEIVLTQLKKDTGINFLGNDAGRFGNFEAVQYLSGDSRRPIGLCISIHKPDDAELPPSLVVRLEPPLSNCTDLIVNCRLFNGGGTGEHAKILDEIRHYNNEGNLWFSPLEPFSRNEISVWSNGKLVAYHSGNLIRSTTGTITVQGPQRRHITEWSKKFTGEARDKAQVVKFNTWQQFISQSAAYDPWRNAEGDAKELINSWFPSTTNGRYFKNELNADLEAVIFLSELSNKPGVSKIIIADPYFDRFGVESLLVRLGHESEVTVIASISNEKVSESSDEDRLRNSCSAHAAMLPSKLKVINFQTDGGKEPRFHDRYYIIEHSKNQENPTREVWMLSNSLSSFARRYPLTITPLSPDLGKEIAEYVSHLETGQLTERDSAKARIIWTNHRSKAGTVRRIINKTTFSEKDFILKFITPQISPQRDQLRAWAGKIAFGLNSLLNVPVSALTEWLKRNIPTREEEAVRRGYVFSTPPDSMWKVPSGSINKVTELLKVALNKKNADPQVVLTTISNWHYHGGPSPTDYKFSKQEILWINSALLLYLKSDLRENKVKYENNQPAKGIHDYLTEAVQLFNSAPLDILIEITPEILFSSEAIWREAPEIFISAIEASGDYSLIYWLVAEAYPRTEYEAQLLLKSTLGIARASGVIILYYVAESEAKNKGVNAMDLFTSMIARSTLHMDEKFLAIVFISARFIQWEKKTNVFSNCAQMWPSQRLNDAKLNELTCLINRTCPYNALSFIELLASKCPYKIDKNTLHEWCINQFLALLPLKSPKQMQAGLTLASDNKAALITGRLILETYGDAAPQWYCTNVITEINLNIILEPLLRDRKYSDWNSGLDKILLALILGETISESALCLNKCAEYASIIAPTIARVLINMGPEVWNYSADWDDRLFCLVAHIGWAAENHLDVATIDKIAKNSAIPALWRIWMVIQSPRLILRNPDTIEFPLRTGKAHQDLTKLDKLLLNIYKSMDAMDDHITRSMIQQRIIPCHTRNNVSKKFRDKIEAIHIRSFLITIRRQLIIWRKGFDAPANAGL